MVTKKWRWLVASLVAALVLAVAAVAVAQEPPAGPGQIFLDNLAKILGIDRAKLDQAFKDAASQTVDEGVAKGWISKDAAPYFKERIQQSTPFWGPMMGWGGSHCGYQGSQSSYWTY